MDVRHSAIRTYFGKLGLETELADMYLALHSYGPQSISELSRNSKVERTRIYRLIDRLLESSLIELETHSKRGIIKAAPISNLRILINQREADLKNLQDELGLIEQALARNALSNPSMRVQFYHGPEGIRQMLRNELNAETEILGYADRILEEATGLAYMQHWTDSFEKQKLQMRLLINQSYKESWRAGISRKTNTGRRVKGIEHVVTPPQTFQIAQTCHLYDNVVSYIQWKDGEVFGTEIYNQAVHDSQRQLFEMVWQAAQTAS